MNTSVARAVDAAGFEAPTPRAFGLWQGLARLLASLVHASAERLVTSQREVPREWFRFPLP